MSDDRKKRVDEGFVPQKPPKRPDEFEKGYEPPPLPKEPPVKPPSRKK